MPTLTGDLDLDRPLQDVVAVGAAFVPHALDETFRRRLLAEVGAGPFESSPEQVGPKAVRQQMSRFVVGDGTRGYPCVHRLRDDLVSRVHEHGDAAAGLHEWLPNDASVQRYGHGSLGVSPHLDGKRFRYLVAVFTLDGAASFALCADRSGTVLHEWTTVPGSLVLMRGPGLAGAADGRPLHTVRGPKDRARVSLTFRFDSRSPSLHS